MKLQLNSHKVFLIGVVIIFLFMFLNRFQFYYGSKIAEGKVVTYTKTSLGNRVRYPVISFKANGYDYRVKGLKDLNVEINDHVVMIYQPSDPSTAVVNSFYGFWLYPLMFCLIPLMIWVSFVYSYITPKEALFIRVGKSEDNEDLSGKFKFVHFSKRIE